MIKVLMAEDSEVQALLMKTLISAEDDMTLVGHAKNGEEAVSLAKKLKPDIITMDVQMPVMDGIKAIQHIMAENPTPIIVVSSIANDEKMNVSFTALEAGALAIIQKPVGPQATDFNTIKDALIDALRSLSCIKVVTRRPHLISQISKRSQTQKSNTCQLVALGASTGGPIAIRDILVNLPKPLNVPVVIVQHLSKGFLDSYMNWLRNYTHLHVQVAKHNEKLEMGGFYFAPDDFHLTIQQQGDYFIAHLKSDAPVNGFKPSVDVLFDSLAKLQTKTAAGLLTGMGQDGANGLLAMKQNGHATFAQDEKTSIVFGMPKAARANEATDKFIAIDKIAKHIETLI